jgi:hypothetical protein
MSLQPSTTAWDGTLTPPHPRARHRSQHCPPQQHEECEADNCWKYALEPTGFDPLVGSDGFDPLWCKSPNGPHML